MGSGEAAVVMGAGTSDIPESLLARLGFRVEGGRRVLDAERLRQFNVVKDTVRSEYHRHAHTIVVRTPRVQQAGHTTQ